MNIPDQFQLTIAPEDFRDATDYQDGKQCPMAIAIKGMFPGAEVNVRLDWAIINGMTYDFDSKLWGDKFSGDDIDQYIEEAQDDISKYDIPTVQLTLTKRFPNG